MASYEDVLAYKAMQDEEKRLTTPQAAGIGAGVGALAGFLQRGKFGQRNEHCECLSRYDFETVTYNA